MSEIDSLKSILDDATMYVSFADRSVICLHLRIVDGAASVTEENVRRVAESSLRLTYATDTVQALMLLPPGNKYADDYAAVMTQLGGFHQKMAGFYGGVQGIIAGTHNTTASAISNYRDMGVELVREIVEIIKKVSDLQYRASFGWE